MGFSIPGNKAAWKKQRRQAEKQRRHKLAELRGNEMVRQSLEQETSIFGHSRIDYSRIHWGKGKWEAKTKSYMVPHTQKGDAGNRRIFKATQHQYPTISYTEKTTATIFKTLHTYRLTCTQGANELVWSGVCVRFRGVTRFIAHAVSKPVFHTNWLHGLRLGNTTWGRKENIQEAFPAHIAFWCRPVGFAPIDHYRSMGEAAKSSQRVIYDGRAGLYGKMEEERDNSGQCCRSQWQVTTNCQWGPQADAFSVRYHWGLEYLSEGEARSFSDGSGAYRSP